MRRIIKIAFLAGMIIILGLILLVCDYVSGD